MVWNHCISTSPEKMGSLRGQNTFILEGELAINRLTLLQTFSVPFSHLTSYSKHLFLPFYHIPLAHTHIQQPDKKSETPLSVLLYHCYRFLLFSNVLMGTAHFIDHSFSQPIKSGLSDLSLHQPFRTGLTGSSLSLPVKASWASLIANSL